MTFFLLAASIVVAMLAILVYLFVTAEVDETVDQGDGN